MARLGGISQFRAASELLERGHRVAVPLIDDDGVDLVVDYRWRIQVKSAGRPSTPQGYVFQLHRSGGSRRREERGLPVTQRHPVYAADYFICHARPVDAWWIIPRDWLLAAGFTSRHTAFSLSLDPLNRSRYAGLAAECRDAWHLLDVEEE